MMQFFDDAVDPGELELTVSQFVALHNQVLEYAMPEVTILGELSNFKVSKNKWVYFDLKDEDASVRFFGTVYVLSSPLEDGMMLRVRGTPRVHPQFGFSISVQAMQPAGEGTIRRAADLLQKKLETEGLFAPERKRPLPYPPKYIGVITSKESAAYADFIKIINARWSGMHIQLINVQVQGEVAPVQIVAAIRQFNESPEPPEVLVITRGGGSADDLWAFSTEQVTRAVASSRIPTLVAIGHEIDLSLAELAADMRASTPSNAAELLVPDKRALLERLPDTRKELGRNLSAVLKAGKQNVAVVREELGRVIAGHISSSRHRIDTQRKLLELLNPRAILQRGYAIVRASDGEVVRTAGAAATQPALQIEFADGSVDVALANDKK